MIVLSMVVVAYAIAMWITAFIIGILDEMSDIGSSTMDEIEWFLCAFWPLTLVCVVSMRLGGFVRWLWGFVPGKKILTRIANVVAYAFKPYAIGVKICGFLEQKRKRAK